MIQNNLEFRFSILKFGKFVVGACFLLFFTLLTLVLISPKASTSIIVPLRPVLVMIFLTGVAIPLLFFIAIWVLDLANNDVKPGEAQANILLKKKFSRDCIVMGVACLVVLIIVKIFFLSYLF